VPISHATPAAAYANNVFRDDYQDLTRDMVGLTSSFHPQKPLPGVDVLLGAGWGETKKVHPEQGTNFVPGNIYITDQDLAAIDARQGGNYCVAKREAGVPAKSALAAQATEAAAKGKRLLGFYGVRPGHLPYRTADGRFNPTISPLPLVPVKGVNDLIPGALVTAAEVYSPADLEENPSLSHLTQAALKVLSANSKGFWLMIEAGDVDWANHQNNIDNAIGAVLSGDEAFRAVVHWIEAHNAWSEAAVIVTADHGHYFMLERPEALLSP
jgi:alkaline phosphatase